MDINTKIIKNVRQFPCLYDNKGSLDERNQAWVQLAEKMNIHEVFLKIRWHSLLQGYQRDVNFKYANNMSFIVRNSETQAKVESWPEFIITEDDLKDNKTEEQEEFVFLEVDDEENKTTDKKHESAKEKECHKNSLERVEDLANKESETIDEKSDPNTLTQKENISSKPNVTEKDDVEIFTYNSENSSGVTITPKVEEKMADVNVNNQGESGVNKFQEVVVEKPQPLLIERCEDVIFGELVSAMLKRMDENKKKSIKKEIMNLLFS